jgi:hypothetical protein
MGDSGSAEKQTVARINVPLAPNATAEVVIRGPDVTSRELAALMAYLDVWKRLLLDCDNSSDRSASD